MILTWGLESYNEALKVLEGSDHPKVDEVIPALHKALERVLWDIDEKRFEMFIKARKYGIDFTDFTVPRHDLPMDLQLHLNNIALSEILNDKIREFEMYSAAGGRELAKLPRGTKVDLEAGKVSRENYAYLYDYPWPCRGKELGVQTERGLQPRTLLGLALVTSAMCVALLYFVGIS